MSLARVWLLNLSILTTLSACSTTRGLRIKSEPANATVLLINSDGSETAVGQTPYEMSSNDYSRMPSDSIQLGILKEGYVKEKIVIEKKWVATVGEINAKLSSVAKWNEAYQDQNAYRYLNDVASLAAEIQAYTVRKEYDRAESMAKSLVGRYPRLSVGWNMLGNIYYLQRRVGDAIQNYEKSIEINPQDQEAKNILTKIKGRIEP